MPGKNRVSGGLFAGIGRALGDAYWTVRPVLRATVFAMVVGGLLFAGWKAVVSSPYFRVRTVDVAGTPHFDRAAIIARVGLDGPVNIFQFDVVEARDALLAHPWVGDAEVSTELPDRAIVRVVERAPAGVLALDGLYLVDGTGRPFVRVQPKAAVGLPVVTGVDRAAYDAEPNRVEARIREALSVARQYQRSDMAATRPLSGVHLATGGRTELLLGQTRVVLGRGEFKAKLQRLSAVLAQLAQRKKDARYILLSEDGKRAIVYEKALDQELSGSLTLRQ